MLFKKHFIIGLIFALGFSSPASSDEEKTITILVSGMSISTSDSVGNVEVRAKSLGPGACGVTYSTHAGSVSFLAPPLMWGDWHTLYSHLGHSQAQISESVTCDTGVVAEISYWAE